MVLPVAFEAAAVAHGVEQIWSVPMRKDSPGLPKVLGAGYGGSREVAAKGMVGRADGLSACVRGGFQRLHWCACGEAVQEPQEFMLG